MYSFSLTQSQRQSMNLVFALSKVKEDYANGVYHHMHTEFDDVLEDIEYMCRHCGQICRGNQIGAHFRNERTCKYMQDRPWLKKLPSNWKEDLDTYEKETH